VNWEPIWEESNGPYQDKMWSLSKSHIILYRAHVTDTKYLYWMQDYELHQTELTKEVFEYYLDNPEVCIMENLL